jgi:hypothetical protein
MKRHPYLPDARPDNALGLGHQYYWVADEKEVDMSVAPPAPVPVRIAAAPQNVVLDLRRTAIVIIDLQNDFCTQGGWVDHIGGDYAADRTPIAPLQLLLPELRAQGVPVVWVNWGNRPDLANMPPNQIHLLQEQRRRRGPGRSAARRQGQRAGEGFVGGGDRRRTRSRSPATSWWTSTASAASGTRRWTASCATWASRASCSPAATPTSACCTR